MNQDFQDLLSAFSDAKVQHLVVGAYALAVLGRPRATGDIDVWIKPSPENARRAFAALSAFGAPLIDLTEGELSTPGVVFQIGVVPRRIDILTEISGVEFEEAWAGRTEGQFGELTFPVIGRTHFLINKRATGRAKDLVDADSLEDG